MNLIAKLQARAELSAAEHGMLADMALARSQFGGTLAGKPVFYGYDKTNQQPEEDEMSVLLEPGDVIGRSDGQDPTGRSSRRCTVTAVSARAARVAWFPFDHGRKVSVNEPKSEVVDRSQPEGMLIPTARRFTPHERANELKNFLEVAGGAAGDLTKEPTAEETQDMPKIKGKGKTGGKAKAAKQSGKAGGGAGSERQQLIWSMLDGTHTKAEIVVKVVEKFGGDPKTIAKRVNDAPFYMRKAGLKPDWKRDEKPEAPEAK